MSLNEKQKQARANKLGCSDLPVIAGLSKWKTPLTLYYQFLGLIPRYNEAETEAQEIGSLAEPMLASLMEKRTGCKLRRSPTRQHPTVPWLVANLDMEIVSDPKGPGVAEFKMRDRSAMPEWDDGIPDDIAVQVAGQLAVTRREWGLVGVLFGGNVFRIYEIARDKEVEDYVIEIAQQFMVRVEKCDPPPIDWGQDHALIKRLYGRDSGRVIQLDSPDVVEACRRLVRAKAILKEADSHKDEAEAYLKNEMKDAAYADVPGWGKISWRNDKAGKTFDEEAFAKAHANLHAKFLVDHQGARRFLVKPNTKEIMP